MKCVVCGTQAPEDAQQCVNPECQDYIWPWRNMDKYAFQLLREGAFYARRGEYVPAVLRLTMAAVLNPRDVTTLRSLGQLLAAQGAREDATYYLETCMNLAASHGQAVDAEVKEALVRLQVSPSSGEPAASPAYHDTPLLIGLSDCRRENDPKDADDSRAATSFLRTDRQALDDRRNEAWAAVTAIERGGPPSLCEHQTFVSWLTPAKEECQGAWYYLQALYALKEGEHGLARDLFKKSMHSDSSRLNAEIYLLHLATLNDDLTGTVDMLREIREIEEVIDAVWLAIHIATVHQSHTTADPLLCACLELLLAASNETIEQFAHLLWKSDRIREAGDLLSQALETRPEASSLRALLAEIETAREAISRDASTGLSEQSTERGVDNPVVSANGHSGHATENAEGAAASRGADTTHYKQDARTKTD